MTNTATKTQQTQPFEIDSRTRSRMQNKLYQFWRFIILNIKILKAVDHSKRS